MIRLGQTYEMTGPDRSQLHHAACGCSTRAQSSARPPQATHCVHAGCGHYCGCSSQAPAASVSFLMLPGCPCHEWLWRAARATNESLSQSLACPSSPAVSKPNEPQVPHWSYSVASASAPVGVPNLCRLLLPSLPLPARGRIRVLSLAVSYPCMYLRSLKNAFYSYFVCGHAVSCTHARQR